MVIGSKGGDFYASKNTTRPLTVSKARAGVILSTEESSNKKKNGRAGTTVTLSITEVLARGRAERGAKAWHLVWLPFPIARLIAKPEGVRRRPRRMAQERSFANTGKFSRKETKKPPEPLWWRW